MTSSSHFSDETINAYIDGELDNETVANLIQAAQRDADLAGRIQQLRQVKEALRLAYACPVNMPEHKKEPGKPFTRFTAIAATILLTGMTIGWLGNTHLSSDRTPVASLRDAVQKQQPWKVVMHVNTTDTYLQNTLLLETENLLASFKDKPDAVQVEIVAYGPGVLLFDTQQSRFAERLKKLKQHYSNLNYAVCSRSIKKIEHDKHIKVNVLAGAMLTRSGLHQIIERQKQGWHYIRL